MRYLFCSFGSPGFLFPMVGLALALRERGHAVAFAASRSAQPFLDGAGLHRYPRGDRDGDSFDVKRWGQSLSAAIDVKHVEYAADRFHPDVLVSHQLSQSPLIVRERRGLPVAVLGLATYLWPAPGGDSPADPPHVQHRRRESFTDQVRLLNELRALFRLPRLEATPADFPMLGDLFMLRTVPALDPELPGLPAQVHPVGACLWEPPLERARAWDELRGHFAEPEAPLVYVQQGRTFHGFGFWPQLVEALADRPLQVVASVGRMDDEVGALPRNVVARPHVSQALVLPRAAAAVSGGYTSVVLAALRHGVPHVLTPVSGEGATITHRVGDTGC
ncbi:MAG TPA: hypothetical protein VFX98_17490, partial [Longimicrobiaceae bacterium]|nr:hypothetical protein [Longimicrobiaceae bacterium]